MAFDAVTVANTILASAWEKNINDISPMKLQKLLFIANALYLKAYDKPLIDSPFMKWRYGPVEKDVYREFSSFGSKTITSFATDAQGIVFVIPESQQDAQKVIERTLDIFGNEQPWRLSELSHAQGTAWSETRNNDDIITNDLIKKCPIYK